MSKLKYSNQLFLGSQELNRQWKFTVDEGFKRNLLQNTADFGIVHQASDPSFNAFRIEAGTNSSTIKVPVNSFAINADGNVLYKTAQDNIAITNNSAWYWIRVSHKFSPIEVGTVSIDTAGNLTGIGTKFTEVLRGQPNFPARITFSGASLNTLQYDVVEVINDTSAVLSGVFQAENTLSYAVFGTFTPGHTPSSIDQYPFQYDACQFDIVAETVVNTPPSTTANYQFLVARVRSVSGIVEIQDKRSNVWKTQADKAISTVDKANNTLIGIEEIRYDHTQGTKEKNQIKIGWGFRSSNFTYDTSLRKLTINAGLGGRFKSTSDFTTGDFNGWLVYDEKGVWRKIISSTKTGADINLFLDILNPSDAYGAGREIVIVPDVEEIEFQFGPNSTGTVIEHTRSRKLAPVKDAFTTEWLLVPVAAGSTYLYNIQWRYKRLNEYSEWKALPTDIVGYYDESSFDINGILNANSLDRVRVPYTTPGTLAAGYIKLTANANNYAQFQDTILTGDLFGGTTITINNANPVQNLIVGTNNAIQVITGAISLSTNHVYNLDPAGASNGNQFTIIFDVNVTPGGYGITFNTGYVNPGTPGTILHYFTPTDLDYMKMPRKQLVFDCRFVDGVWRAWLVESDTSRLGAIENFSTEVDLAVDVNFDNTGKGVSDEYLGWALCNGSNGTHDLRERFIAGSNYGTVRDGNYGTVATSEFDGIGGSHGSSSYKLTAGQSGVQAHSHPVSHTLTLPNHTHTVIIRQISVDSGSGEIVANNPGDGSGDANSQVSGNPNSNPAINGSIAVSNSAAIDAADYHENRPAYIILGFMQRVPFPGGNGGPGGSITYPQPQL
jgi:hypothetical protein